MKKRLLITGATGLVGQQAVEVLKHSYVIDAIVRKRTISNNEVVVYHETDFSSNSLPETLPTKIDAVIHLAQSNNMRAFPQEAIDIFNVNVKATQLLLDYAQRAGASSFILASTGGLYGMSNDHFTENSPIQLSSGDLSYYFRSKYVAENLAVAYSECMSIHILRPFFVYGASQKRSMLLPRLVENVQLGNPIRLQGEAGLLINPVHVRDVVKLIEACLSIPHSQTVNVAGPDIISLKAIVEMMSVRLGKQPIFNYAEGLPVSIVADNSLMKSLIQRPLITLEDGLDDLL